MQRRYTSVMRKMVSVCGMSLSNVFKDHSFSLFELETHFSTFSCPNAVSALKRLTLHCVSGVPQPKDLAYNPAGLSLSGTVYTLKKENIHFTLDWANNNGDNNYNNDILIIIIIIIYNDNINNNNIIII